MPFKSEKQRRWMWANKPEMARRWAEEEKKRNDMNPGDKTTHEGYGKGWKPGWK